MELVLRHPNDGPIQGMNDLVAIVVCDEPATAPRACALLSRVGRSAGVEGRLIYSWWTFSVLASTSLRQLAVNEAAAADMVIIATREGPGLPESVKDWISRWLATGEYHHRPRALVALLEPGERKNGVSRGVLAELKGLAVAEGVEFFANRDEVSLDLAGRGTTATVRQFARVRRQARGADCRAARAPAKMLAAGLGAKQPSRNVQ
jgi:hypothetical protein